MKALVILGLAVFGLSSQAKIQTAEYYLLEGLAGEYPSGYELTQDVEVYTVESPANPYASGVCTLKKGSVIHPWAKKTLTEFVSLHPVTRYTALKDSELVLDWDEEKGEPIVQPIKNGELVIELAYLSEGQCRVQVGDTVGEQTCVEIDPSLGEVLSKSPFAYQEYFKTQCKDGRSAWMDLKRLTELVDEKGEWGVKYAEVEDWGSVKEP